MKDIIVVKIGGVASGQLSAAFFNQLEAWQNEGKDVVLVHGGGRFISDLMDRLAIPVKTIDGLRVTTAESLEAARMALIGQVQPNITAMLSEAGFSPVGLHAGDEQLLTADFVNQEQLGLVGKLIDVNVSYLKKQLDSGFLPVIAPLGVTKEGQWLNVNADAAACDIAASLQAAALYLLTDVPGVKKDGQWLKSIAADEIGRLAEAGVITGGMLPKLSGAKAALAKGVRKVHITDDITSEGTIII